jgi:RimJ/RimL family protein N-acetyltransferase
MKNTYLFTSERLGFRLWEEKDTEEMFLINQNPMVMEFFPDLMSEEQTNTFILKMNDMYHQHGYCYFAVDILDNQSFIGFIGLAWQTYDAFFTPCVDIGWRIATQAWNKGYATEGARRCLEFARQNMGITKIYAVAPKINTKSERIMINIGMQKAGEFDHPFLTRDQRLQRCVVYEI